MKCVRATPFLEGPERGRSIPFAIDIMLEPNVGFGAQERKWLTHAQTDLDDPERTYTGCVSGCRSASFRQKIAKRSLLRHSGLEETAAQRWTSTGILQCVRTLTVSLPRTIAEMPWRPCEAMTIRSQPFDSAVSRIAW